MTIGRARLAALRLAKAGYGGGSPDAILGMPVETVLDMLEYENFVADYEREWVRLNTPEGGQRT